jgi:hypothetical protein
MKGFAKPLAVLLLALAPAALTPVASALAQPHEREVRREQRQRAPERPIAPQAERNGVGPRQAYPAPVPAPVYRGPAPNAGGYVQSYPAYPRTPPAGYAYPPPNAYGARVYAPNSLGAGWAQQQDQARIGVRQGRMIPLGQVMQRLKTNTPGRLLDAGLEPGPDGRPAYRVRWAAAGGRRIDFIVDAVTGAILSRTGY